MAVRAVDPEAFARVSEPAGSVRGAAVTPLPIEGDIEVLGQLVLDRVAEIVELRELLDRSERNVAELTHEVEQWRGKALSEAAMRKVEAETALRHERELVTVIHAKMTEIDTLSTELDWRRLSWWRRLGRTPPPSPPAVAPLRSV
ncbi:MAG: hypothetical protein JOY80_10380 [Candidatus Dormibacteraeota bacterium]|nr:hypothetical protein [Candidatus Dormibacteraeota bacterium]